MNDFLPDAAGFELPRLELEQRFDELRDVAIAVGVTRELLGQEHANGIPLEYTVSIDPGVVQQVFHLRDKSLRVTYAALIYETPSPYDPGVDDTAMEYVTIRIDSDLMPTDGITIQESFTIAKIGGEIEAYVDVEYHNKDGTLMDLAGQKTEQSTLVAKDEMFDAAFSAVGLRHPFVPTDLEAVEQLRDALDD